MNVKEFNEKIACYVEENMENIPSNVLKFLKNSKVESVDSQKVFGGEDSPSDYWVNIVYKNEDHIISYMYQCHPSSETLDLSVNELSYIYVIYSKLNIQDLS